MSKKERAPVAEKEVQYQRKESGRPELDKMLEKRGKLFPGC